MFQLPAADDRWPLIVALLRSPAAESRRLGKLLTGWPATVRRHLLVDDCHRRLWLHPKAQMVREQEAVSG